MPGPSRDPLYVKLVGLRQETYVLKEVRQNMPVSYFASTSSEVEKFYPGCSNAHISPHRLFREGRHFSTTSLHLKDRGKLRRLDLTTSTAGRKRSAGLPGKCAGLSKEQMAHGINSAYLTDSQDTATSYWQEENPSFCCG